MSVVRNYLFGWAAAVTAACAGAQRRNDAATRAELERLGERMVEWQAAGQADSLAGMYLEHGMIFTPNAPPTTGREAIAAYWRRMLTGAHWDVTVTTLAVHTDGALAVERGRYAITITFAGSPTRATDRGNYVLVWSRGDQGWRILYDLATSEVAR